MGRPLLIGALLTITACAREKPASARADSIPAAAPASPVVVAPAAPATTVSQQSGPSYDSVAAGEIPADIRATCDTATRVFRATLSLDPRREDGSYRDTPFRDPRIGCRLSAEGSFLTFKGDDAVDSLVLSFEHLGWHRDTKVDAAGPDGQVLAVRKLTRFCILTERVAGHDDSDTTPPDTSLAARQEAAWFQVVVECSRDVVANADEYQVPDSLWRIARDAGLDTLYAFSHREGSFPKMGDFDGDGREELAVLVEERATGKLGFVVVNPATRRTFVVAAGTQVGSCPDDLGRLSGFEVWRPGVIDMSVPDDPRAPLRAAAVYVTRADTTRFFYFPLGPVWMCEVHAPSEKLPERQKTFMRLRRPPN